MSFRPIGSAMRHSPAACGPNVALHAQPSGKHVSATLGWVGGHGGWLLREVGFGGAYITNAQVPARVMRLSSLFIARAPAKLASLWPPPPGCCVAGLTYGIGVGNDLSSYHRDPCHAAAEVNPAGLLDADQRASASVKNCRVRSW